MAPRETLGAGTPFHAGGARHPALIGQGHNGLWGVSVCRESVEGRSRARCHQSTVPEASLDGHRSVVHGGVDDSQLHSGFAGELVADPGRRRHDRTLGFEAPIDNGRR
jgi:hypothetical protein